MQVPAILLVCILPAAAQQATTIRTDVSLVELQAKVTDSEGHAISGLTKDAFRLFIDDVPRDITAFQGEDAPVTAGIVIDNSASMAPKRDEVIAAALAFARASNPKDQMFVVHFNDRARLGLPLDTPFTGSITELEAAVATFHLGGTTAFYDALLLAESQFRRAVYSRKVLLTITDGGDNSVMPHWRRRWVAHSVRASSFIPSGSSTKMIRIGILRCCRRLPRTPGAKHSFPRRLPTSRQSVWCRRRNPSTVRTRLQQRRKDGAYHRIRLTVSDPKYGSLQVQTRLGYIARQPAESSNPR